MAALFDDAELTKIVSEVLHRWPVAGLAVGVVRDGELAWSHGHGVADVESGRPADEDTVFRIGSITKTMTAVAVMQLVERGALDLDAPAEDYLRGARVRAAAGQAWLRSGHGAAPADPHRRCARGPRAR